MDDLEEFEALKAPRRPCVFQIARDTLSDDDYRKLQAADESGYSNRVLARWLTIRGVRIKEGSVARHRNGSCNCV